MKASILNTLKTFGHFLLNKAVIIVVFVGLLLFWVSRKGKSDTPFAELILPFIIICFICIVSPIVRFLIFREAADYAEQGQLEKDLALPNLTPAYIHYRFATTISFVVTLITAIYFLKAL